MLYYVGRFTGYLLKSHSGVSRRVEAAWADLKGTVDAHKASDAE